MSGTPKASQVTMTQIVMPGDTNPLGTIFGGRVMEWIDIAASVAANRHCRGVVVTASIDELHFRSPVKLGMFVNLQAQVNFAHTSSMEIGVRVESEDPRTGDRAHTASAYVTMVSLDANGKPRPVPPLRSETDEDRRRAKEAEARRAHRLSMRQKAGTL